MAESMLRSLSTPTTENIHTVRKQLDMVENKLSQILNILVEWRHYFLSLKYTSGQPSVLIEGLYM